MLKPRSGPHKRRTPHFVGLALHLPEYQAEGPSGRTGALEPEFGPGQTAAALGSLALWRPGCSLFSVRAVSGLSFSL